MADLVLVVEDDPANAVLVKAILSTVGGFEVITTDDGDEVMRVVAEQPVAAVLMDVSLGQTRVENVKVDGVDRLTSRFLESEMLRQKSALAGFTRSGIGECFGHALSDPAVSAGHQRNFAV